MNQSLFSLLNSAFAVFSSFPKLVQGLETEEIGTKVRILAIGKSAYAMTAVCTSFFQKKQIDFSGYLLTKYGFAPGLINHIKLCEAGHPTPDANSLKFSREIVNWLQGLQESETLIVLISGGSSALFEIPGEGLDLQELILINQSLLHSGKSIAEINTERSKISQVKGGKALKHIRCKQICCFALSDVEGNDPAIIGSGAFFCSQAKQLAAGYYSDKARYSYRIIGDNLMLRNQIANYLPAPVSVHRQFLSAPVDQVSGFLASFALEQNTKGIHIFGGEAPVKVTGKGLGGRCTQLALDFAGRIEGNSKPSLFTIASDNNDNLEGVSGAYVDGYTCKLLRDKNIDISSVLKNNDSFSALQAINAILPPLSHPVNANDIYLLIIA